MTNVQIQLRDRSLLLARSGWIRGVGGVWLCLYAALMMSCAENQGSSNHGGSNPPTNETCGDDEGEMLCNDRCVDTRYSGAHCGGCAGEGGQVCSGNTVCSEGRCQANCTQATQTRCGNSCSDLENDRQNCGACGLACGAGLSCVGGVCACPEPLVMCGTECVDVNTDKNHCGGCFNRLSQCNMSSNTDPCDDVKARCSGTLCYCDDPLCSNRTECRTSTFSQQCPLPAPTDRCVPECSHVAVYRGVCSRLNGTSASGGGAVADGGSNNSGGSGGSGGSNPVLSPIISAAQDLIGENGNTSSSSVTNPDELPVSDECAATHSFGDNTCDLKSCTQILSGGLMTVDPNVEIVGSLSRPGDEADCFTFYGKDDVLGLKEAILSESIQINFTSVPVGHQYEAKMYFIKDYDVSSSSKTEPYACDSNPYVYERELSKTGDASWAYTPGVTAGDATGQYFVLISRKPGVGSDCGGEYRLVINGLR